MTQNTNHYLSWIDVDNELHCELLHPEKNKISIGRLWSLRTGRYRNPQYQCRQLSASTWGQSHTVLLEDADKALYQAKK